MINWNLLGGKPKRLIQDSRQVKKGDCFIATIGSKFDSRHFILQAVEQGASCILWEKQHESETLDLNIPHDIPTLGLTQLKEQLADIANEFYDFPSRRLWVVGVTGTNGKTSCTQWISQAMSSFGKNTAVIGTIGNGLPNKPLMKTLNTTPIGLELQSILHQFVSNKNESIEAVAMEVSSHGLHQNRVSGVKFDVAVFTNFTRDHLDYHHTMQEYLESKLKLFEWQSLKHIVVNIDDPFGKDFINSFNKTHLTTCSKDSVITYSLENSNANLYFSNIKTLSNLTTQAVLNFNRQSVDFQTKIVGKFNLYNLLAVCGTLICSGISLKYAVRLLEDLLPVCGRMEIIEPDSLPPKTKVIEEIKTNYPLVLVDYAHTPDALENALNTLNDLVAQGKSEIQRKITCVFGCGGNRDQGKRPLMGKIAGQLADKIIITNDNPRLEDPQFIINQIIDGIESTDFEKFKIIPDRLEAIRQAINESSLYDIVLIAGKGHENYQDIQGIKLPFSDQAVVAETLDLYLKN